MGGRPFESNEHVPRPFGQDIFRPARGNFHLHFVLPDFHSLLIRTSEFGIGEDLFLRRFLNDVVHPLLNPYGGAIPGIGVEPFLIDPVFRLEVFVRILHRFVDSPLRDLRIAAAVAFLKSSGRGFPHQFPDFFPHHVGDVPIPIRDLHSFPGRPFPQQFIGVLHVPHCRPKFRWSIPLEIADPLQFFIGFLVHLPKSFPTFFRRVFDYLVRFFNHAVNDFLSFQWGLDQPRELFPRLIPAGSAHGVREVLHQEVF